MKRRPKRKAVSKSRPPAAQSSMKLIGLTKLTSALNHLAAAIVREITDQMDLTMTGTGKTFSTGALDEWTPKLRASVSTRLLGGGNWTNDRPNVLAVASDMARIASILSGGSSVVNKGRVHAAFRACKDHLTCPGNQGSGRWCDFDI